MNRRLLAVDGGGSKTAFSLRDEQEAELYAAEKGGSNWHAVGETAFRQVMEEAAAELLQFCPDGVIDTAVFALAGTDTPEDETQITEMLRDVFGRQNLMIRDLLVENDAFSVLKGLLHDEPGVLLISGTGAIAFAQDDEGTVIRAGGWGHRTGDGGGGRWMGMRVIDAVFRAADGREPATALTGKVLARLRMQSVDELCNWVNGPAFSGHTVAGLTRELAIAAEEGDRTSILLIEEAAEELGDMTAAAIRRLGLAGQACPVYCAGGNLQHFDRLFSQLEEKLTARCPHATVICTTDAPIDVIAERARHHQSRHQSRQEE
ncbi:N-acetylmuramic acid/N-acetylglucosamine kinase [Sporosarcina sp. NCCP-2716]|uniref:BadF/BadG/BcrA/BcrD ATPase family protein n=1 Tax=Sporosarcina sp. NCCP-2716 TaxID=2943679 RepID=UPI00203F87B0|nr:BadF/BadG/BcrA/BcrD ATPase family protein [Sporosarcina sp. NCCP-2716]GKV70157.1 N-acetylmuramic acid/N-acetylglucosamine kinase [Sporosarcina sp. NCCP-2716]